MFDMTYQKMSVPLRHPLGNGTAADLNNDRGLDLIFAFDISSSRFYAPNSLVIYRNDSVGQYSYIMPTINGQEINPPIFFGRDIWAGDINQDGLSDFIPLDANEHPNQDGTGTFRGESQYAYISSGSFEFEQLKLADINITAHGFGSIQSTDGKFRFMINNPWVDRRENGAVTVISTYEPDLAKFSTQYFSRQSDLHGIDGDRFKEFFYSTTLDVNNDGNTDIIGFSSWTGDNAIYLNDGRGRFSFSSAFDAGLPVGVVIEESTAGDFNGDGLPDLAVLAVDRTGPDTHEYKYLRILLNDNGLGFKDASNDWLRGQFNGQMSSFGYLDTYDFNRDGLADFVFNHFPGETIWQTKWFQVFVSTGSGFENFTITNEVSPRTIPLSANTFLDGFNQFTITVSGSGTSTSENYSKHAFFPMRMPEASVTRNGSISLVTNQEDSFLINTDLRHRLVFEEQRLALDLDADAGKVAKILGAVFGKTALANKEYAGIGLRLLDIGMSYQDLAALAMSAADKKTSRDICDLLWYNVTGSRGTDADLQPFQFLLDSGQLSVGQLTSWAADTSLNQDNIDLVGLAQTGLQYV